VNLKLKLFKHSGLIDVGPEDIKDDSPLVGGDIGIDSIDVLELVMMMKKTYGVKIESKELGRQSLASVRALATHNFLITNGKNKLNLAKKNNAPLALYC